MDNLLPKQRRAPRLLRLLAIFCLLTVIAPGGAWQRAARAASVRVCASGCDFTTIQAAIDDPGVSPGDVILVADPVHTEAGIRVDKDLAIQGSGAERTFVQAHASPGAARQRVFFIASGATVSISDMTILHGNPLETPEAGGGVMNEGTLTLENVVLRDNSASAGGGLHNNGVVTLVNCTVRDNLARGGGDSYYECSTGGGLKNMAGEMTLVNSAVLDNQAEGKGGGIHVACNGVLRLTNSTISGNRTANDGGGVFINGVGEFVHATISNNQAKTGGGVYLEGSGEVGLVRGQLNYTYTIIAGNIATMPKYGVADCALGDHASIGVNQSNLVADGSCAPAFSADPMLAPLEQHENPAAPAEEAARGRAPAAHALLAGSPAIDAIPAEQCALEIDQRGLARPQGAGCDLGAFELERSAGVLSRLGTAPLLAGLLLLLFLLVVGLGVARRRHGAPGSPR